MNAMPFMPRSNMTMRVLITGGAGFIASHLAEALLEHGHHVTVIDNLSTGRFENIQHLVRHWSGDHGQQSFRFVIDTLTNEMVLDRLASECDVIFHLAAAVGVKLIVENPVRTIETNIMGTEAVLKAALRYRAKVLIASTSEVYGKSNSIPFCEDDDIVLGPTRRSRWAYAASKMVDEFLALAYHREKGLPVVIFRLFNTVGPRQTGRYGMVIPRFVHQALRAEPLTVYGDGQQSRCFLHVCDAVAALIKLAECPQAVGKVFNVGSTAEISILALARQVLRAVDPFAPADSRIIFVPYEQAYVTGFEDMQRRVPSIARIREYLGWEPIHSLDNILRDVIASVRREEALVPAGEPNEVRHPHARREAGAVAKALLPRSSFLAQRESRVSHPIPSQQGLHILVVTGIFPPDIGGPATYVPQVATALANRGHRLTVVTLSDRLTHDDTAYPFQVVRLPRHRWKLWRCLHTVETIRRLGRMADVLFVHGLTLESVLANTVLRKPLVLKVVGDQAWERCANRVWVQDTFEDFQRTRYGPAIEALKALHAWCIRRADRVIVPSRYLARWVATWDVPDEKLVVIHNALASPNGIQPADLPLSTRIKVATVGRLVSWKRVDQVIEAVASSDTVGLVIIGDGPERAHLESVAHALGIVDRVYFAGQWSKSETLSLMAACDIFVLNSTYEGLPHVVLEAMALGLPVIATAVGGTPEVVEDWENGRLIAPMDHGALPEALQKLTSSPVERQRLAARAKQTAERFNVPRMVEATEAVLRQCAKQSPCSR